jgi:steroid delta-isomerase-like uncharacterized protein
MSARTSYRVIPLALALLAVTSAAITGCGTTNLDGMLERNRQLVRQMNAEVWNNANLDAIDGLFTPDFVLHFLPDGSDTSGLEGLRKHVRELHGAFPDWSEDIKRIVAERDLVVIHYVSSGTNQGQWLGKPPTGNRVQVNEMSIFRIEDGRIAEQWLLPDMASMQQQLAGAGDE